MRIYPSTNDNKELNSIKYMARIDQWIEPEKIFDAHMHFFEKSTFERFAKQRNFDSVEDLVKNWNFKDMKLEIPPEDHKELADRWIKEMDDKGCDKAILYPEVNQYEAMAHAVTEYPDRFTPYLMLNPLEDNALELVETCYSKYGIVGFKLYPPSHYYHAYDERLTPFYEFANDHNMYLTYHFGISVGVTADIRFMNPADLSPVARDYTHTTFALAHFATGYLRELLFLMYHVDNVYAESSSSNAWMKYMPFDINLQQVFEKVITAKGADHIIFGTDSSMLPRGWRRPLFDLQLAVCNQIGLSQGEIDGIFFNNLETVLKKVK